MKYLPFAFLLLFCNSTLAAQDTLYVKGKKEPLIVKINVINEKTLNSLKKVKKIKFGEETKRKKQDKKQELETAIVKRDEFRSATIIQSVFTGRQTQVGPNYMHRISSDTTEKMNIWVQFGGGYYKQHTFRRDTKGHYWEFGARFERISRRDPKNCFHIGFDINQQWAKGTLFPRGSGGGLSSNPDRTVEEGVIAVQIPIGYTHRADNGLYISAGLEVTILKELFPAFNLSLGYCFLK